MTLRVVLAGCSVGLALLASCTTPMDRFDVARVRLERGDLIGALVRLDQVPPGDPDYAEARSLAMAVERRIRTSQRLFARGLALRAQWRDDEAIDSFELAREVWPELDGVDALIAGTRGRITTLEAASAPADGEAGAGVVTTTTPVEEGAVEIVVESEPAVEPVVEVGMGGAVDTPVVGADVVPEAAGPSTANVAEPGPFAMPIVEPAPVLEDPPRTAGPPEEAEAPAAAEAGDDTVIRVRLQEVHAALRDRRVDDALTDLRAMNAASPSSRPVREMLTRVLHQRALVHYGQGELARAVDVWSELLEVAPDHRQAREFHDAATSELEALRRR